jgi:hypothetical protein
MNQRLIEYLNSIEISHLFSKNHKHGLEFNGQWNLFEPTKFVYAFFAFNMVYSIDWETSISLNRIQYFNNRAKSQFVDTIKFISDFDESLFETELSKLDPKRRLYAVISRMTYDRNSSKKSEFTNNTIAQDFKIASKKFSDYQSLNSDDHFDLLQMSYTVRNNIFHGEKKAMQMIEAGQRERLLHYANIILATNEAFFEVMRRKCSFRRMENWEVTDNII